MKKLRESKTFLVNLLVIVAGAIGGAIGTEAISPSMVGYFAAALGAINIILRMFTNKSIKGV